MRLIQTLHSLTSRSRDTVVCDVSDYAQVQKMHEDVLDRFGKVHCLMSNAGIGRMGSKPWEDLGAFNQMIGINLMGIVHTCHAFIPSMLEHGEAGAVINTGSKQGITRPPGNYAYNLSKTGVLAYTESIAIAFRNEQNCNLAAHLLIPAFVYTPMVAKFIPQKPPFAATAEETVSFMLDALAKDEFYILCPDNETPRALDEKKGYSGQLTTSSKTGPPCRDGIQTMRKLLRLISQSKRNVFGALTRFGREKASTVPLS